MSLSHRTDRRRFLKQLSIAGAASALSPLLLDPYAPLVHPARASAPVRIRGRVEAGGRGIAGVRVTDGRSVVRTAADGTYEFVSASDRPYVYTSVPSGYAVPQNETGTARFYRPIQSNAQGEMEARFSLERLEDSDERHAFVVLADPQTEDLYELGLLHEHTVPDVQATVRTLGERNVFGVACGDIMFDKLEFYPEYERAVRRMGVPFFQVVGNHDMDYEGMTDEASTATFRGHFGPTYYSWDRGAVHYVVLDDVFWNHRSYSGYLDATQLEWLRQDLLGVEPGRPIVVFLHIPVLSTQFRRDGQNEPHESVSLTNRELLYRMLEPYQAHVISGHTHEQEHVFEGSVHEHVTGATCGAWWSGPICFDGTPNGYGVYEVDGETIRWRHKGTGLDAAHQMRLYGRGAVQPDPQAVVANVWDWEPEWKVFWYEDGGRKGEMARRTGTDPLSEQLHRGEAKPERRTWVEPLLTDHLFHATPSAGAREIRVEATDRFGRTYTDVLALG